MEQAPTIETRCTETAPGLVFDVSVAGRDDAPLVLMLHGFCVSRYFWHNQMPALAEAGYLAMAPNQRGYSPGARPDPADFDNYRVDRLIGDALDIVAATGQGERRFHLVGHDWGGSLAWLIADRYPERLATHRRHKSLLTPLKAGAHREDRSRPARLSANPPDRPIRRPRESGDPGASDRNP
jgi:alpha-beta hydrolase superfamily lysophospholipase